MSSKSPGLKRRELSGSDSDSASPLQVASMLLLCCHGMYILGITSIILAVGLGTTGIMNVIARGYYANAVAGLWSGLLTLVNGFMTFRTSLKPIMKEKQVKLLFFTSSLTIAANIAAFTIACIAIFNEFHYLGNQLRYACDRDPNHCATAAGDPNYSGNNLNPNYNPNCEPNDPFCNIGPTGELNYNPSCWQTKMQQEILRLYNHYSYSFRYSYVCDTLQLLFCAQVAVMQICQLILLGYVQMQISEKDEEIEPAAIQESFVGLNNPLPNKNYSVNYGEGSTAIYANLPPRMLSPPGSTSII